jgi:uncharacterized protein
MGDRRAIGVAFLGGLLFAAGLLLSGMTQPARVLAFLDLGGDWDPSLLLVMGGAWAVHAVAWQLLRRRGRAWFGEPAPAMPKPVFDTRLFGGAALFGMGWGLARACPGPALLNVTSSGGLLFGIAMLAGIRLSRFVAKKPALEEIEDAKASAG